MLEGNSDSKLKVEAKNPEMVLKEVYGNLENLKRKRYRFASEIQKRMRIVVSVMLNIYWQSVHTSLQMFSTFEVIFCSMLLFSSTIPDATFYLFSLSTFRVCSCYICDMYFVSDCWGRCCG